MIEAFKGPDHSPLCENTQEGTSNTRASPRDVRAHVMHGRGIRVLERTSAIMAFYTCHGSAAQRGQRTLAPGWAERCSGRCWGLPRGQWMGLRQGGEPATAESKLSKELEP